MITIIMGLALIMMGFGVAWLLECKASERSVKLNQSLSMARKIGLLERELKGASYVRKQEILFEISLLEMKLSK